MLELRRAHMSWGPRKLKRVLEREEPQRRWPAASTIGAMVAREGWWCRGASGGARRLTHSRLRRPIAEPRVVRGLQRWFRTADGERIDPLTITDACSRYLLRCQGVEKIDAEQVRAIFEAAFRECGLPGAIRTDNGAPFASRAVAGLSRLAVWWMKLGIVPERIAAGHPEQNGRHERMHRTLKQETASPPAADRERSSGPSIVFGGSTTRSVRTKRWGCKHPVRCTRRRRERIQRGWRNRNTAARCGCGACSSGLFRWKSQEVFLSETLRGERIGLLPMDERFYTVYFAAFPIARFDSHKRGSCRGPKGGFLRGCRGRGSLPFPCTPSPPGNEGKSVRNVPGLKCQVCPGHSTKMQRLRRTGARTPRLRWAGPLRC